MNKSFFIKIIAIILCIFITLFLVYKIYLNNKITDEFTNDFLEIAQNNEKNIFSIDKIIFSSSCNADTHINSNSTINVSNLYQYTDIAIFLNSNQTEFNQENTLKELYIDNIQYNLSPSTGTYGLYYKDVNNFGKLEYLPENKINKTLNFTISSNDKIDFSTPILYNNCANPIVITHVNSLNETYTLDNNFNFLGSSGSLFKKSNINLTSLKFSISLDVYITNNLDQKFKTTITLSPSLENESKSIYDNTITLTDTTLHSFYRFK